MDYTLFIYMKPEDFEARSNPETKQAFWGSFGPYLNALMESGIVVGSGGLQDPATATTVRFNQADRQVQDGPFAEIKEQLGGYFTIRVDDLDTALQWAARCPVGSGVEVRPNLSMG